MSSLVEVQKNIRKALEKPMATALTAAGLNGDIRWSGLPFDLTAHTQYVEMRISWGEPDVREMGSNPTHDLQGFATFGVFTAAKKGQDENDRIQAIIAAAYPYAAVLSNGGVDVYVDKLSPGGYANDDAWMSGLFRVHWRVLRRV